MIVLILCHVSATLTLVIRTIIIIKKMSYIKRQTERLFANRNGILLKTHFKHIYTYNTLWRYDYNKAALIARVFIREPTHTFN